MIILQEFGPILLNPFKNIHQKASTSHKNLLMSGIILHGTLTQLNGQKSLISLVDQILCHSCHLLKIRKSLDEKTMTERIQTGSFVSFHTQHGYFEQLISIIKSNLQTD